MKDERKIIELAKQIALLEKECQLKNNVQENVDKMEQLVCNLSLEDIVRIDTYI